MNELLDISHAHTHTHTRYNVSAYFTIEAVKENPLAHQSFIFWALHSATSLTTLFKSKALVVHSSCSISSKNQFFALLAKHNYIPTAPGNYSVGHWKTNHCIVSVSGFVGSLHKWKGATSASTTNISQQASLPSKLFRNDVWLNQWNSNNVIPSL